MPVNFFSAAESANLVLNSSDPFVATPILRRPSPRVSLGVARRVCRRTHVLFADHTVSAYDVVAIGVAGRAADYVGVHAGYTTRCAVHQRADLAANRPTRFSVVTVAPFGLFPIDEAEINLVDAQLSAHDSSDASRHGIKTLPADAHASRRGNGEPRCRSAREVLPRAMHSSGERIDSSRCSCDRSRICSSGFRPIFRVDVHVSIAPPRREPKGWRVRLWTSRRLRTIDRKFQ